MTTTALMPVDPAISPQQVSRVLNLRADLLPQEIIDTRRGRRTRAVVIVALALTVALMGVWRWHVTELESEAIAEADQVAAQLSAVQKRQSEFTALKQAKNARTSMTAQLSTLLATDLPWSTLLDRLRATGAAGDVTVTGVSGSLLEANGSTAATLPGSSTSKTVATLTVTGTAPDKKAVARYVTALADVPGVADPYLTNAAENDETVDFSLTVNVTEQALCGRFSKTECTSGGK